MILRRIKKSSSRAPTRVLTSTNGRASRRAPSAHEVHPLGRCAHPHRSGASGHPRSGTCASARFERRDVADHRRMTDLDQPTVRASCARCPRPSSTSTSTARSGSTPPSTSPGPAASTRPRRSPACAASWSGRSRRPGRAAQGLRPADRARCRTPTRSSGSPPTSSRTRRATTSATPRSAGRRCSTAQQGLTGRQVVEATAAAPGGGEPAASTST